MRLLTPLIALLALVLVPDFVFADDDIDESDVTELDGVRRVVREGERAERRVEKGERATEGGDQLNFSRNPSSHSLEQL